MLKLRIPRALLVLVLLLPCATAVEAKDPTPTVEVTAKLIDIPSKFPPDDLYDYVYVMQYQVKGGPMDKQTILVGHYKPRRPRADINDGMKKNVGGSLKRFEVGAVHQLVLTANMREVWKGAVVDEYFATDRKSTRYFCLKADPAK